MIQVQNIIDLVRRNIRQTDEDNSNWTNLDLIDYLNQSLELLPNSIGLERKVYRFDADGSGKYPLPSDLVTIESVQKGGYTVVSVPFSNLEITDYDAGLSRGMQYEQYAIYGNDIWIAPTTTQEIIILYRGKPPRVANVEANLEASPILLMPLVYRIAADCMYEVKDFDTAGVLEQKFQTATAQAESAEWDKQLPTDMQVKLPRQPY